MSDAKYKNQTQPICITLFRSISIVQHEYLEFHVEYIILSHYVKEGFPNHSCIAKSLDSTSQQSTIQIVFICYLTYGMRLWSIFQMLAILAPSYNKSTPHIMVVAQWQR